MAMVEPWQLNLRHLRALGAIGRLGSISAAAAAANLTQPALTQGLAKLERLLGRTLFERRHDGIVPTEAASLLLPRADAALAHVGSTRVTMAQLRALVALAQGGSYVSASAATGLSQPSLHRAVHDVSLALGRTLVERRGRGLALTAAGRRTVRDFRLALGELRAGLGEVARLDGGPGGQVAIGAMPLARARLLPAVVAAFHRAYPHVAIRIVEGSHAELIEPLRDGELDVLIGALRDPSPGPDVAQTPLFTDRPVVVGRRDHPLTDATPGADWTRRLCDFPWTLPPPGTPLRLLWEAMFRRDGLDPPLVPVECGSALAIRGLLLGGDFLTLLSPDQVAVEIGAGWLVPIGPPPDGARIIGLTVRSGWHPTRTQRAFVEMTRAMSGEGHSSTPSRHPGESRDPSPDGAGDGSRLSTG